MDAAFSPVFFPCLSRYLSLFLIQVVIKSIFELLSLMAFQKFFFLNENTDVLVFIKIIALFVV